LRFCMTGFDAATTRKRSQTDRASSPRPFDGNKTYKLRLPQNIPAKLVWSVTLYDPMTGAGPRQGSAVSLAQSDGSANLQFRRLG
jgi:hypothetical protein